MDWTDRHDYFNEIDEGYLSMKQFLDYNFCRDLFKDELEDAEIYSMSNSNKMEDFK